MALLIIIIISGFKIPNILELTLGIRNNRMAGIYIHIPFCRQACHYCDFHFSTNLQKQSDMVNAIAKELVIRKNYVDEPIETVYFGGGTPSLLKTSELKLLIEKVYDHYEVSKVTEITLEANPEDLTQEKLDELKTRGINRLSIGFQTFNDASLAWMNRVHDAKQAIKCYKRARKSGFDNISIDLIYALPSVANSLWHQDVENAIALAPDHISLYGLTIEQKTVFGHQKKNKKLIELPEENAAEQYLSAIEMLKKNGYEHYEVSNFCKPGYRSKHNSAYWKGVPYLGIGPGAHSFNGNARQVNIPDNTKYIKAIEDDRRFFEIEKLATIQLMNEYILTSLRTSNGILLPSFRSKFGVDLRKKRYESLKNYERLGLIKMIETAIILTPRGFLVADDIALELFFTE